MTEAEPATDDRIDKVRFVLRLEDAGKWSWKSDFVRSLIARIDTERARAERAEAQAARLRKALQGARQAINDAPIDTWGVNYSGDPSVPQGSYSWPMKDEYLHHIDAALKEPANG